MQAGYLGRALRADRRLLAEHYRLEMILAGGDVQWQVAVAELARLYRFDLGDVGAAFRDWRLNAAGHIDRGGGPGGDGFVKREFSIGFFSCRFYFFLLGIP